MSLSGGAFDGTAPLCWGVHSCLPTPHLKTHCTSLDTVCKAWGIESPGLSKRRHPQPTARVACEVRAHTPAPALLSGPCLGSTGSFGRGRSASSGDWSRGVVSRLCLQPGAHPSCTAPSQPGSSALQSRKIGGTWEFSRHPCSGPDGATSPVKALTSLLFPPGLGTRPAQFLEWSRVPSPSRMLLCVPFCSSTRRNVLERYRLCVLILRSLLCP